VQPAATNLDYDIGDGTSDDADRGELLQCGSHRGLLLAVEARGERGLVVVVVQLVREGE